jgi:hypothetical protein
VRGDTEALSFDCLVGQTNPPAGESRPESGETQVYISIRVWSLDACQNIRLGADDGPRC